MMAARGAGSTSRVLTRAVRAMSDCCCKGPRGSGAGGGGAPGGKVLTMENLNPNIIKLQYAVRGPLVTRAAEIEKELQKVL